MIANAPPSAPPGRRSGEHPWEQACQTPVRTSPAKNWRARRSECTVLDGLIDAVRAGESRVLVVHGEPGVGKTVLLDYLAGRAAGCRVARVAGAQSEMELAFAGLHQLCAPLLDLLRALPAPQREALADRVRDQHRAQRRTGSWSAWPC